MISNITSGEWIASPEEFTTEWRVDAGTWGISICADFPGDGNVEANARLIAAAPELLEACKRMMLWFEVEDDHSKMPEFMHRVDLCNQVEMLASAAIAKATGEPQ